LKHRKIGYFLLTSIFLFFLTATAFSQPDQKSKTPAWLQLSFEQRTRYERLTNSFRFKEFGVEELLPLRTRVKLEIGEQTGSVFDGIPGFARFPRRK
jgi:hypothetical protein